MTMNDDKRKAVMTLLSDSEWSQWSDAAIARRCAVSDKTVTAHRQAHSGNSEVRTYTTKHGTTATMKVGNIGKHKGGLQ